MVKYSLLKPEENVRFSSETVVRGQSPVCRRKVACLIPEDEKPFRLHDLFIECVYDISHSTAYFNRTVRSIKFNYICT